MRPDQCPLCTAPASHLETLAGGAYFCNVCGKWFGLNDQGTVTRVGPTQHVPAKMARPS